MEPKTEHNKTNSNNVKESIEDVMRDLEEKINPKSMEEGLRQLQNNSSNLFTPMEAGAKEFEARVGRPMTYGEMRAMWG